MMYTCARRIAEEGTGPFGVAAAAVVVVAAGSAGSGHFASRWGTQWRMLGKGRHWVVAAA